MSAMEPDLATAARVETDIDEGPAISLFDMLQWLGDSKLWIAIATAVAAVASAVIALLMPNEYTARATCCHRCRSSSRHRPPLSRRSARSAGLPAR